jgi:GNAT superfamily N-acetyltransferase
MDRAEPTLRLVGIGRRTLEVWRTEGLRGLWWRGLGVTVYRRLMLVARRIESEPPRRVASADVTPELLTRETVGDYLAMRRDTAAEEVERRLATGQRCVLVRRDGAPVSARWFATGFAEIHYLDLVFDLPEGVAYVYDVYTAAAARGLGISAAVIPYYERMLRDAGCHTLLGSAMPENRAGRALVGGAGYEPVGTLGCVRVGSLRVPVRRLPDGYVGRARRLVR